MVNGTAPDECFPIKKKLRKNPIPNMIEGNNTAVRKAHRFGCDPKTFSFSTSSDYR